MKKNKKKDFLVKRMIQHKHFNDLNNSYKIQNILFIKIFFQKGGILLKVEDFMPDSKKQTLLSYQLFIKLDQQYAKYYKLFHVKQS